MSEIHTEVMSKEIQTSSDMFIGEGVELNNPRNIPGFKQTTNFKPNYAKEEKKKKGAVWTMHKNECCLMAVYA